MKPFRIPRLIAFLLALLLLCLPLCSCKSRQGKALLTLDSGGTKISFSVNFYQFMLARLKGDLISGGVSEGGITADSNSFWDIKGYWSGDTLKTVDALYREQVLENCKTYLAGLWLFEKEGLKLSKTASENVQQQLKDLITYYGNGSKTKLNALLSEYGMNYEMLKSFYEAEAKLGAVQNELYGADASKLATDVKDLYLNEHYLRYKRIFLSFQSDTKEDVRAQANSLLAEMKNASDTEFEAAIAEKNGGDEYTDGYYLPRNSTIGETAEQIAFFNQITAQLESMQIGETALIELDTGFQILRRLEPTSGAYNISANAVWFSNFAESLMAELFAKECETYFPLITMDETVLATAPSLKEIVPDYYF